MKKFLTILPLVAILFATTACNQKRQWTQEQRKQMRETLRDYRRMVYLEDLTDPEFVIFTDDVATDLEQSYPVYTTFVAMPAVQDTVEYYVVTTIVDDLRDDARNMAHIYPYDRLVANGVLPSGLDREQQHAFYRCMAGQIDTEFGSLGEFFEAVWNSDTTPRQVQAIQQSCADDLFDWQVTVTETTIVED